MSLTMKPIPLSFGAVQWTRQEMISELEPFARLYETRPIKDNAGGMASPHMFATWFLARKLQPEVIIESGVWYGQGTWLLENACPEAQIYCIDLELNRIRYKPKNAIYFDRDFSTLDWSKLPKASTLVFFDDHQNALERVRTADSLGFRHLIFEDNYPPKQGDCYTLKKAFHASGFEPKSAGSLLRRIVRSQRDRIAPNNKDAEYLRNTIELYYEFPPVFQTATTRWGDPWQGPDYLTPEPLLQSVRADFEKVFLEEATCYTWLCYARIREK